MKILLRSLVVAVIFAPILVGAAFFGYGGHVATIETPSMGTYAPVGTLVITTPVKAEDLYVGETILFTPPDETKTYFHRIERLDDGKITTHGDLNVAVDPWTVTPAQVHGHDVLRVPYLGWLLKYLPFLLLGGVALGLGVKLFVRTYQLPVVVLGASAVLSVANIFVKPFVRADMLSQTVTDSGKLVATFVVTGILPLRATTASGRTVTAIPGDAVTVQLGTAQTAATNFHLTPLFLNPTLVALAFLAVTLPLGITLLGRGAWLRQVSVTPPNIVEGKSADTAVLLPEPMPRNVFAGHFNIDAAYRNYAAVPGQYRGEIDRMYQARR